jgi:ATP-dependent helicase/nuclease subunit A
VTARSALEAALAAQRAASEPSVSAFVDANAGAGKTAVLTARVARLLLAGSPPAKILCVTYTRAAAAEMSDRLLKLLGAWTLADDDRLEVELRAIEGDAFVPRSPSGFAAARRLFARALETPGGLKIQTIHSFCESVLRRFPLEAGVAPGFSVIDEGEAARLTDRAFAETCAGAPFDRDEPPTASVGAALRRLARVLTPDRLTDIVRGEVLSRRRIDAALERLDGWPSLRAACARAIGADPDEGPDEIIAAALATIEDAELKRAEAALTATGGNPKKLGLAIGDYFAVESPGAKWERLVGLFLTEKGAPRERFGAKPTVAIDPGVEGLLRAMRDRFVIAYERVKRAENLADTSAFLAILMPTLDAYASFKAARAGLDYDDLIAKAAALLKTGRSLWVRYKLDQGLDHVLLDEAQDTSPAQWAVIEGLCAEFFAGEGARDVVRTIFAVGDQKQSIYSFQGADADLFHEKQIDLGKRISAAAAFRDVPLALSFRSSSPPLAFVDALFSASEARDGVSATPVRHSVRRDGEAGCVELWPLIAQEEQAEARAWDAPLDATGASDPKRRLADAIAAYVRGRIGADISASRGRKVAAGDFMILAQSRSALFHEMIRALARAGVPVAGADRIKLLEEPAVEDVLSYARAVLLWSDDLSLAETLKSPFFGFDDDDLFALAHAREGRLRAALIRRGESDARCAAAAEAIETAAGIGRNEGAFAFLSHILDTGEPSGRKRLFRRLGPAAGAALGELMRQALDYERANPRSLQGFVVWAERNAGEIKRDLEPAGDAARVMTVHGAKGLEADIVILLDAHRPPELKLGPLLFARGGEADGLPVFSRRADADSEAAQAARAAARQRGYAEYRRLLYVAATRARDELIVCGLEGKGDPHKKPVAEKTWHALACDAFGRLDGVASRPAPWGGAILSIKTEGKPAAVEAPPPPSEFATPPWLFTRALRERAPRRIAPSDFGSDDFADVSAYSPLRPQEAQARGRILHRLLELLPKVGADARDAAARRLVERLAPRATGAERAELASEALRVLNDERFAAAFGPASRAEVAIAGRPRRAPDIVVSGRIDRLLVEDDRLLLIDYKTNRPPPPTVDGVPEGYLRQLAAYRALLEDIYPGRRVEAALLWTHDARLTPVPSAMLDGAFARALSCA